MERQALGEFDLVTLGDDIPPREQHVRTDVVPRVVSAAAKPQPVSGEETVQQIVDGVRVHVGKTASGVLVPVARAPRLGREPCLTPRFLFAPRRRILDTGYLPGRDVPRAQIKLAVQRSVR